MVATSIVKTAGRKNRPKLIASIRDTSNRIAATAHAAHFAILDPRVAHKYREKVPASINADGANSIGRTLSPSISTMLRSE